MEEKFEEEREKIWFFAIEACGRILERAQGTHTHKVSYVQWITELNCVS